VNDRERHPPPPPDLHARQPLLRETSQRWIRIHPRTRAAIHFGRGGLSRFDDPEGEFGVLYTAEDAHGAFIERFGRQLSVRSITATAAAAQMLSKVEPSRSLRLVDLASSGGLARLSADSRLTCGGFGPSQTWSRALWLHPVRADGIYYRLRHDNARCGCALFDRAGDAVSAAPIATLMDRSHRRRLADMLDTYGFAFLPD
jgi:hypothetical protein